jgi:AMP-polyphosphate phosphotransferase
VSVKQELQTLRDELLELQFKLRESKQRSVALVVTGAPAAGRSETVNELLSWLDPKFIRVQAFGRADFAERRRPPMWRYWQKLPAYGRMAFYFAGWYADALADARRIKRINPISAKRATERIVELETMLHADGVKIVKIHLFVDRKTQQDRLERLCADKLTRWRVTDEDHWLARHHDRAQRVSARYIKATSHRAAPWHLVNGAKEKERVLEVGRILCDALREAIQEKPAVEEQAPNAKERKDLLSPRLEVKAKPIDDEDYDRQLESLQGRLALLLRRNKFRKHALVLAFEGMDAAGKGGAIRRISQALDARQYQVVPISAPSTEEAAHPYLWRFWRNVPPRGDVTIFDRSWYGRVLVERVRGFTAAHDWKRAYAEINEFEEQLTEFGIIVVKFWLNVSPDEQLKRFKAREEDPLKRFKVDKEDWTNREHYDAYRQAAGEMIAKTNTPDSPWVVVDADAKKLARLQVLETVCEEVEKKLAI